MLPRLHRSQLPTPSLLLPGMEEQRRKLLILLPSGGATVDTAVAQWSSRWVERPVGGATRRQLGGSLVLLKLSLELLPGDQQPDGATHHYYCHHGDREWGIGVAGGHEADMPARAQTSGGVGCRASLDCSQRAPN